MADGTDPSDDKIKKRSENDGSQESEEMDPLLREFETALFSDGVILPETLGGFPLARLPAVLDRAISDERTLKTFRASLRAVCEDPNEALEGFRDDICAALANEIRDNCLANPIAACGVLTGILDVALTTVVSIGCNPANSAPPALTDLMTVLVGVIDKLSDYRTGSEFSFEEDELTKRLEHSTLVDMWDILNAKAFHVLNRGLRIAGYVPPPALLDDCANLLGALMAPVDYDMGPRQSGSEVDARAWAQTLRLAATLGKVGSADLIESSRVAIEKVAQDLVLWKQGEVIQEAIDPKIMREIYDEVEKCEHYALRALFACKQSDVARSVWNEVIRAYPITCTPYRMALISVAKFELMAARRPVVRVLRQLGGGQCTEWEQERHLGTILQFLELPGAREVLESAFDTTKKPCIPVVHQAAVIEQLKERYTRHVNALPAAMRRLKASGSKDGEPSDVVRSSEAKNGVIWNAKAREALRIFTEVA